MVQSKQASLFSPRGAKKIFPLRDSERKIILGHASDETSLQDRQAGWARSIIRRLKKGGPPMREDKKVLQRDKNESLREDILL